jgi:APA family basic amino acid/polyamine antiporter
VGYLAKAFGGFTLTQTLIFEIAIVVLFTLINLKGICFSGTFEMVMTTLKIVPLVIIPLLGLWYVTPHNFTPLNPTDSSLFTAVNSVILLTIWGYIGLETGAVPSGEVTNARRVVPRAIVMGTLIAAVVYIMGTVAIMGVIPRGELMQSSAPYADLASVVFGGQWHQVVAILAVITCLGALNGWILVVGQIAYGAAQDGLFPPFFKKTATDGAPLWGLVLSSFCIVPFMAMSLDESLINQFNFIVDVSVTLVLVIYILCVAAYIKFLCKTPKAHKKYWCLAGGGLLFALGALWAASLRMALLSLTIFVLGIPIYMWRKRQGFR